MKVCAIIVTYNGKQWLDRCLCSVNSASAEVSTIVVDNASTDGTPEMIEQNYPSVHLVKSDTNLGFAKANNVGIRIALDEGADYVLLLNQDAWLNEDAIGKMLEAFESDEQVGIVSPIHMNGANSALDWGFAGYVPEDFVSDAFLGAAKCTYEARFVNAAAWMVSRECLEKVGGFDTSLFVHYGEDSNFNQRRIYHGFKMLIATDCSICHDREFRKDHEAEYRSSVFKQTDVNRRLEYGNILYDIDIDGFIKQNKRSLLKSYLKLKLKQAKRISDEISFLETVRNSREVNRKGGLNWL